MNSTGQGLPKDYSLEKYDAGKTQHSVFPGNLGNGNKHTVMMVFGKLQFTSPFASDLSSLTKTQVIRRSSMFSGALLTSGSFTMMASTDY